jgi:hypothetical protein
MLSSELLPIYLNDHFAAAGGGVQLARRAAGSNEGNEFGAFLSDFAAQADADRSQLEDIMGRLEVSRDEIKTGAVWLGEKLGRLKLNGRLVEYSPLSRVIEFEGLIAGAHAKEALWRTLAALAPDEPRIADVDFVRLIERAREQIGGLEQHHQRAAELMLATR